MFCKCFYPKIQKISLLYIFSIVFGEFLALSCIILFPDLDNTPLACAACNGKTRKNTV